MFVCIVPLAGTILPSGKPPCVVAAPSSACTLRCNRRGRPRPVPDVVCMITVSEFAVLEPARPGRRPLHPEHRPCGAGIGRPWGTDSRLL